MPERAFSFLRINERSPKPRKAGLTEIRGPYYTPLGKRQLEDILETAGEYVDSLKDSCPGMADPTRKEVSHCRCLFDHGRVRRDTENVKSLRTEVPAKIIGSLGLETVMFEAADPKVFTWYVKNYGPEANLFVDHSQVVQLECVLSGIWGTTAVWAES